MHLDDGQIRAVLDNESGTGPASELVARHLESCQDCQARLAELKARSGRVGQRLAFLAPRSGEAESSPRLVGKPALGQFKQRLSQEKEIPMLKKAFGARYRALWATAMVVALLVIGLSIPSGRAWAGQFLGLFRVQQVAVIPIDPTGLMALNNDSTLTKQISQLLSNSVSFDKKPDKPQPAADAAEASQMAGFTVRLPDNQATQPKLTVQGGTAFNFAIDRERAQALLDEAGHKDLVLPASIDKETVSVNIPTAVTAAYGTCPDLAAEAANAANGASDPQNVAPGGSTGRRYPDCVMLAQIPSPTVNTPPDMDIQKLAEIGLEFTGMTPDQAQAFSQSVDWTSSLVIPIPRNAATYKQLTVDGVTGTLIQRPADDAPEFALVWVKDGIIYTIGGLGADSAKAIDMANAMK